MKGRPKNLFVVGNAYCSFDPIFGQGLSVAAIQVSILQQILKKYCKATEGFDSYYREAEKIIQQALNLSYAEASQSGSKIDYINRIKHQMIICLSEISTYDTEMLEDLIEVMHLNKPVHKILTYKNFKKMLNYYLFIRRKFNENRNQ
ncbi:hypothetical protein ACTNBL_13340 [Enterococcus villorum]|uniref:FAD-binding domain-containing protein n=2 Tax=Enterococcus villorum TaxID=112904 RepID=A0A511J4Q1_9ENTE|nr:hypothetical protein [Enterococcus villorum]EOH92633.1 hypothetical protein UAO_00324 [Enterococcus villorum ATCC 700913]EOW75541.1 hypothetical protein I591_02634 [Enterococcus villorum ATCC 700913]GEL92669.1 hypothetical protein EVI01_20060 [Enterococcus villorum]